MSEPKSFKVGEAPWEKEAQAIVPQSFKVGEAPWEKQESQGPQVSKTESAVRGVAQGASLGFADEATGAFRALVAKALDGDKAAIGELYRQHRDESRKAYDDAQKANPGTYLVGEVGGSIGSMLIPGLNIAKGASIGVAAGKAALAGGAVGLGQSTAEDFGGMAVDTATGAVIGGAIGSAAPYVGKKLANAGKGLKGFAEKTAVNATGATGKQASEFADDAGRQLLDRGIVKFGDSQEMIAARAEKALKAANQQIDDALAKLDAKGGSVEAKDIFDATQATINKMKSDPSKADIAKILEGELENLINSTQAKGTNKFGMVEAEGIKRGYNRKAGNWADPEKSQAGKDMYQSWRGAVEDTAQKLDPKTAKLFEEGKKSYGLLAPMEEAAQRRASTTQQSPAAGLLDLSSAIGGFAAGGPVGGLLAPVARRLIAPRLASTVAVSADKAGNVITKALKVGEGASRGAAPTSRAIGGSMREKLSQQPVKKIGEEKKGSEKWADEGAKKLQEHGASLDPKLLKDPKAKKLLLLASDLKPGSKKMQQIAERIRRLNG